MAATLGNGNITFGDSTVQSTAAVPLTGGTMTGTLELSGASPQIKFIDTAGTSGTADFCIHVNDSQFYILPDRTSDGAFETPYPLQLDAANNAAYTFGNTILHSTNYNTYAPTKTGTGASGTWAIAISGNAATATSAALTSNTVAGTNAVNLVEGGMADNDFFRIRVGGTATNAGWVEIATADDGSEPIYVRQYTGAFTTVTRTATLLDGSGNTSFPGSVTATSFSGAWASMPAGTRLMFAQSAAPTGWTQVTDDTANNRMLRVVTGAGNGTGGSHSPILNNVVPAHTHGFTTGTESANHTHAGWTGGISANHQHIIDNLFWATYPGGSHDCGVIGPSRQLDRYTGNVTSDHAHYITTGGVSANHTHSGSTDNGSSQTNWTPRYVDLIMCTKN